MSAVSFPPFRFLFCETVTHDVSFLVAVEVSLGILKATLFRWMWRFTASEPWFLSVMSRWFLLQLLRCLLMRSHVVYVIKLNCAVLKATDFIAKAICRALLKSRSVSPNKRRRIAGSASPQTNRSLRFSSRINSVVSWFAPVFVWPKPQPQLSVPPQRHQLIDPSSCMSSGNCSVEESYLVSVGNANVVVYTVHRARDQPIPSMVSNCVTACMFVDLPI